MFTSITIRPGEYFEGEEVTKIEGIREKIVSFDFISSMEMIKQGPPNNQRLTLFRIFLKLLKVFFQFGICVENSKVLL